MGKVKEAINRLLQLIAFHAPGAQSLRVLLHRWRGVKIGKNCWIGYEALLETSRPHLIQIGDNVIISILLLPFRHAISCSSTVRFLPQAAVVRRKPYHFHSHRHRHHHHLVWPPSPLGTGPLSLPSRRPSSQRQACA